jgi:alkylation response protein AidB-like acyl-CoA dehydrogenase
MVPIRSRVDHLPYPGVEVGDIGTKMGYNSVDNGYLKFDKYRVPRDSLL